MKKNTGGVVERTREVSHGLVGKRRGVLKKRETFVQREKKRGLTDISYKRSGGAGGASVGQA